MPATIYQSSDAGAPTGTVGVTLSLSVLDTILNACLVTGYGSKAGAGWTRPFTPTSSDTVFRNGEDAIGRSYYRFNNTNAQGVLTGYTNMTDLTTGTGSYGSGGGCCLSITINSWSVLADSRTALVRFHTSSNRFAGFYIGDIVRASDQDNFPGVVMSGTTGSSGLSISTIPLHTSMLLGSSITLPNGGMLSANGANNDTMFVLPNPFLPSVPTNADVSTFVLPTTTAGAVFWAAPIYVASVSSSNPIIRGRLRWMHAFSGGESAWAQDAVVSGLGTLNNKSLIVWLYNVAVGTASGAWSTIKRVAVGLDLNDAG